MQPGETIFTRTSVLGRLVTFSAIGGVLAAAMVLPIVAATGVLVRNQADKFTNLTLDSAGLPQRSEILDRNGNLLAYVYGVDVPYYSSTNNAGVLQVFGWDRQPVTFGQIAPQMVNAVVAIEDSRYWVHGAIDLRGTIRAAMNDIQHKPVQGGSTIAQQYVKNVLLLEAEEAHDTQAAQSADAETLNRKLNELRMAVASEHQESKQDILAGYLNDAFYGNNAYGIEAAAETYFGTTAAKLTVTEAATLAGIVENPSRYNPIQYPAVALERRNTVLARMAQTDNGLTATAATADETKPLGLNKSSAPQSGCTASSVGSSGFFCQYVEEIFLHDTAYGKTPMDRAKLLATGGLKIYTTLNPKDQAAANQAVNYVVPSRSGYYNPGHNADAEAMIQPGTGQIEAIAEDRSYGTGYGQTEINYAVNTAYGGSAGVQTGSSSKVFTLITALNQGTPFGFTMAVPGSTTINGYTDCQGAPAGQYNGIGGAYNVTNAEGPQSASTQSLYTATTNSVNVFYAELEKRVGLCNVVHTAVNLGLTRADGTSLLSADGGQDSADNIPSFTLGSVNVSPLSMAAAYATVAARGMYCSPVAIGKIVTSTGGNLAVPSANCRRAISSGVADAVNYILQGVLTTGTAGNIGGLSGREAAGKTGTSNVEGNNGTPYAAFAGYTPNLVGYVSVFNPYSPTGDTMGGQGSCYRLESGSQSCPGEMFGADAPGSTWHMSFDHAALGPVTYFVPVPADSPFNTKGNGQVVIQPKKPGKGNGKGNGNGNGNGNGGNGNGNGGNGGFGGFGGGNGNGNPNTGAPLTAAFRRIGESVT